MKVLVLAGGASEEREVSLESGAAVATALREKGHIVGIVDSAAGEFAKSLTKDWDVVFPVVHGTGGEDGVLQAALQEAGLRYVGSSPLASELTFDKIRTNAFLGEHGIDVPKHVIAHANQTPAELVDEVESLASLNPDGPCLVTKPPCQGSSIGISIVRNIRQIPEAVQLAFHYGSRCLIEQFIPGREISVPVVDGVAYPPIEISAAAGWYDYHAKYKDDRTCYKVAPDGIPNSLSRTAVRACELCGVVGIARVDFRLDNAGKAWMLEINTVPGMTSHSLVPKSAAAVNKSLGDVCEAAISTCLREES